MPRPASESASNERYLARWYETFVDVCKAAKRRHLSLICHPSHKAAMMDMMERVAEDPLWNMGDLPPIIFYTGAPKDTFQLVDEDTKKVLTFREAMNSGRGLGRFDQVYAPDSTLKNEN